MVQKFPTVSLDFTVLLNDISITSAFLHRSSLLRATGVLLFFSAEKLVWDAFLYKVEAVTQIELGWQVTLQNENKQQQKEGRGLANSLTAKSDSNISQNHSMNSTGFNRNNVFVRNHETILTRGQRARACSYILTQQNLHNANLMPVVIITVGSSDEKRPVFGLCWFHRNQSQKTYNE